MGGRVRSHLAPAGLLQSCYPSPPFAARAAAYDLGLGFVKARASTSALWAPGHIQPLTFSEDDQSSMTFSQENSRAAAVGRLSACSRRKFVLLLIKVFAMRDMGITAEQQQGGAEALGELHPFKAQTAVTVQEFCHQRCTQDAGIKTWEPRSPGSVDSISHSVNTQ